jgi:hypothetical protein
MSRRLQRNRAFSNATRASCVVPLVEVQALQLAAEERAVLD